MANYKMAVSLDSRQQTYPLGEMLDHLLVLGAGFDSLSLNAAGNLKLKTAGEVPADQLAHLGLEVE